MEDIRPNPTIVQYSAGSAGCGEREYVTWQPPARGVKTTGRPAQAPKAARDAGLVEKPRWQAPKAARDADLVEKPRWQSPKVGRDAGLAEKPRWQAPQAPREANGREKGLRNTEPARPPHGRRVGLDLPHPNPSATSNAARTLIGEPSVSPNRNYGRVPAYLKQRKQELAEVKQAEEEERTRERVPEGLRRIGEAERMDSLMILAERYDAAERAYAALPLRCTTEKQRIRRGALEQTIDAHARLVKAYSKPKVYVGADSVPLSREEEDEEEECSTVTPAFDRPPCSMYGGTVVASHPQHTTVKIVQPPGGFSYFKLG